MLLLQIVSFNVLADCIQYQDHQGPTESQRIFIDSHTISKLCISQGYFEWFFTVGKSNRTDEGKCCGQMISISFLNNLSRNCFIKLTFKAI